MGNFTIKITDVAVAYVLIYQPRVMIDVLGTIFPLNDDQIFSVSHNFQCGGGTCESRSLENHGRYY